MSATALDIAPIVYAGPSVSAQDIARAMPQAHVRPPIRRGDLYRDRMLRYSVFVVIDGVFHQHMAVPVREVVDVLQDDAVVIGASSMGALRAAECWPAGMQGVGSIYRLYRRGSLGSDDEVAVAFDPDNPQWTSVPLINVRHAVSRAVRHRQLDRALGVRLLELAVATHYTDRHWRTLLRTAGADDDDRHLESVLIGYDLKRSDAIAALGRVSRQLADDPTLAHRPRRSTVPFASVDTYRERTHSALDGRAIGEVKPALYSFLRASGRQRSVVDQATNAGGANDDSEAVIESVWMALKESGDLDAEIFRWRAINAAYDHGRRVGAKPSAVDQQQADAEIAMAHKCESWAELERQLDPNSALREWIVEYRERLAGAKRRRADLFPVQRRLTTRNPTPASD